MKISETIPPAHKKTDAVKHPFLTLVLRNQENQSADSAGAAGAFE